jgi:hypothetical protein
MQTSLPFAQSPVRQLATLPCLTICQPWAWAAVTGIKQIENRPKPSSHRGVLLIHAGKSRNWMEDARAHLPEMPNEFVFGAIVGAVYMHDCVQVASVAGRRFAWGPWCHLYRDARVFRHPIPYRGQLGLFRVPIDLIHKQDRRLIGGAA